ncbi:MAG: hypothetical protein KGJ78_02360 [Alphaproteobacteria bacterium]|nr:hypothetical protein [Alphaproteobacteria bacterium]
MSGLYYLGSIVAIFIVLQWFIRNDKADGTHGILAVRSEGAPRKPPPRKWTREGASP